MDENELAFRFYALSSVTKSEEVAVEMVKTVPAVLSLRPELIKDNFGKLRSLSMGNCVGVVRKLVTVPTTITVLL